MQQSVSPDPNLSGDAIDSLLGITPDSPLHALRRTRPEFVSGTQACQAAVLVPKDHLGLPPALRQALAARMARLLEMSDLAEFFLRQAPEGASDKEMTPIAEGGAPERLPLLHAALARHCDAITLNPHQAARADLEALAGAGLTTPQIVALSELIAFVNFQARVITCLDLLKSDT